MQIKDHLSLQFEKRVFDESYSRIFKCLSLLREEELWSQPNPEIPAIGSLIMHMCGNARQWMLSGLGETEDNRDRDSEFQTHPNIKKSELIFLLENLKVNIRQLFRDLEDTDFEITYHIQGFKESGFSVVVHVIEHFSYHTGQITTLTKLLTNKQTGYYEGYNLNKLNFLN